MVPTLIWCVDFTMENKQEVLSYEKLFDLQKLDYKGKYHRGNVSKKDT
jgi:hypothetical protein